MLAQFIVAQLSANATVAGYVGNGVYAAAGLQDAKAPYVTFEEFDGDRFSDMGVDADMVEARVRLHIWHANYSDAWTLADGCRKALQRFRGVVAGTTIDDVFIVAGGPHLYDAVTKLHHLVRDFKVIYRET